MTSLLRNVAALIAAVTILQLAGGLLGVRIPLAVSRLWPNPALTWGFMSEPEPELGGRCLPCREGRA